MDINKIHKSTKIDDQTIILGDTIIGENCKIINSFLENATLGDNVEVINSTITNSNIENNVIIGPYAHLRSNTVVCENAKIGNFVEIKNSKIGKRTKVAHLAYIGDAEIGEDVNVGCGVIFANYDGENKHKIMVGNRVFIGSNSNLVAPLFIEDDVFVAAGTTVTSNLSCGDFCIGRVKNEIKKGVENLYAQKFMQKLKYFGTDGIRGIYGEQLTNEVAQKVGFSLTQLKNNPRVLVGRDTRESGAFVFENLAKGICFGGGEVVDVGVITTAGVCYLTKLFGCDFGIMITASHNPSEYNGIKIFSTNGYKLPTIQEKQIEGIIENCQQVIAGGYNVVSAQKRAYFELLSNIANNYQNLKIYLDCANGSASLIAPKVFSQAGACVVENNTSGEINKNAGVLDEKLFFEQFINSGAEIGFCFDGDADRVKCATKKGVLDGDKILYLLAKHKHEKFAVGTIMTNVAIEKHLKNIGTKLIRVDVGDKYIAKEIKSKKYNIGAEKSGHVIIAEYLQTGDGIVCALELANIYMQNKQIFDECVALELLPCINETIVTTDKNIIKNDEFLNYKVAQEKLLTMGRIIVRASGTEDKIRIMVEDENIKNAKKIAQNIKKHIQNALKI